MANNRISLNKLARLVPEYRAEPARADLRQARAEIELDALVRETALAADRAS